MQAAASTNFSCVKLLLQAGADPHNTNKYKYSALHYAAEYNNNPEVLRLLVTAGVNLEERDEWGATALTKTVGGNKIESAKLLLDCGADINSLDKDNDTPLHDSLFHRCNDMTELLLSRGASDTLPISPGGSILHFAALSGGLRTLEILRTAVLKDINTEATDKQGKTALQVAQQREGKEEGFLEKFQELLVDIRTRNAALAQEQETSRTNSQHINTAVPSPPNAGFRAKMPLNRAFWFLSAFLWSTLNRIRDLRVNNPIRLDRKLWTSILIYWVLGLGWAGFIYVMFFEPGRSGRES